MIETHVNNLKKKGGIRGGKYGVFCFQVFGLLTSTVMDKFWLSSLAVRMTRQNRVVLDLCLGRRHVFLQGCYCPALADKGVYVSYGL